MDHESYAEWAKQNRTRMLMISAPRGRIYNRDGKLIVENYSSYSRIIIRRRRDMRGVAEEIEFLVKMKLIALNPCPDAAFTRRWILIRSKLLKNKATRCHQ